VVKTFCKIHISNTLSRYTEKRRNYNFIHKTE